jgi:hypothetical protein
MQARSPTLWFELRASTLLLRVSTLLGLSTPLGAAGRDPRFAKHLARCVSVM